MVPERIISNEPDIAACLRSVGRVFTRKGFGELAGGFAARKLPKPLSCENPGWEGTGGFMGCSRHVV
jgi:hypothetical protein